MSVKKFLIVLVSLATTAAIAGGPDRLGMAAQPRFQNSLYLEGHLGYAVSDWSDFNANTLIGASGASNYTPTSNGNGGFTGGLDLGYNFTHNIALESGWFYLPTVNVAGTGNAIGGQTIPGSSTGDVASWALYLAAKLSVPVMDSLGLYGKLGVSYRHLTYSGISSLLSTVSGTGYYWSPIFAAGLEYTLNTWLFGAQYAYIPAESGTNNANATYGAPDAAPQANLITAFVGYKFNI